jgi:hypothetical protein
MLIPFHPILSNTISTFQLFFNNSLLEGNSIGTITKRINFIMVNKNLANIISYITQKLLK